MYEGPILRSLNGEAREFLPHSDELQFSPPNPTLRVLRRVVGTIVIVGPVGAGIGTGHAILGSVVSAVALFAVGLIAFGHSILDNTIELY